MPEVSEPGRTTSGGRGRRAKRAAATTTQLVDATIDAIAEVGYANATTEEICRRAGVTQGALFHHFATRRDVLMAAIARLDDLVRRTYFESVPHDAEADEASLVELVRRLRDGVSSPLNLVWLELLVEARTDPELLTEISGRLTEHWSMGRELLAAHPSLDRLSEESRQVWFDVLEDFLAGETIWALASDDDLDADEPSADDKVQTLVELAGAIERWRDG